MSSRWRWSVLMAGVVATFSAGATRAESPWQRLIPFKRVEADVKKAYWLTEDQGPWMILATSFAGPGAEQQAHALVLDLRRQYKMPAFMHKRHFDNSDPVIGRGLNRYGGPRKMKNLHGDQFDEIAVLVGNYPTAKAPTIPDDLDNIKTMKPKSLSRAATEGGQSTQRFAALREFQRLVHLDPDVRSMGPMRRAFVVRNPKLPKEFFVSQGIDPLVLQMNKHVEWGLLKNKGSFTVRVASFQGDTRFKGEKIDPAETKKKSGLFALISRSAPSKLELAAENAHHLTEALRQRGIPAWEFHDRFESIVTIGSFPSVGEKLPNGSINLQPEIYRIMQTYGADRQSMPGNGQGFRPRSLDGISFDVQPMPVRVPKKGIGDDYVRRSSP